MSDNDLFAFSLLFGLTLVGTTLTVLGLGVLLQIETHLRRWTSAIVIVLMAFGIMASSALSGRDLRFAAISVEAMAMGSSGGSTSLLRLLTVLIVGLSTATIISRAFTAPAAESPGAAPSGRALYLSFLVYFICGNVLNAVFGAVPAFRHNVLYVMFVVTAVFSARGEPLVRFITAAKLSLAFLMAVSLVMAVIKPDLAMQPDYKGLIPGVTFRLWGVGSNPNSIGPLALLLMMLELMQPSRRAGWRICAYALGLVVFVLAQSKTVWLAGSMTLPLLAWYRFGRTPDGGTRLGFVVIMVLGLAILFAGIGLADPERLVRRLSGSQAGLDITTLTGRVSIWQAAIRAWQDNPTFGYGPLVWGAAHRASIGLPSALSAHNQFLQSLSAAGLLGLGSMTVYLFLLGRYAWRAADQTRGVSLALYLVLVARCVTEAPLSESTLFNGDILAQVVFFRVVLETAAPASIRARGTRPARREPIPA